MVKSDCFAFINDGCNTDCHILTYLYCRSNTSCPFYKTQKRFDSDIMEHNGTTDLDAIKATYAAGHVEKGESNG